jgi:AcrR family transcriptional regulator
VTTSGERSPRADAIRNRAKLVAAARAVFARLGPDAPLEEVARAAGVSRATLHRHFDGRDALAAVVFEENVTLVERRAHGLTGDPRGVVTLYHLLLDMQLENPALAHVLSRGDTALFRDLSSRTARALEPLLDIGRRAGVVHADIATADLVRTLPMAAASLLEDDWASRPRGADRVRALLHRALFATELPSVDAPPRASGRGAHLGQHLLSRSRPAADRQDPVP